MIPKNENVSNFKELECKFDVCNGHRIPSSVDKQGLDLIKGEPNLARFKAHGLTCYIHRHPNSGHLCGYVGVPPGHVFYGATDEDPRLSEIEVHFGLTWSEKGFYGLSKKLWFLGFDCAHCYDLCPFFISPWKFERDKEYSYKDFDFVIDETVNLAYQFSIAEETKKADLLEF